MDDGDHFAASPGRGGVGLITAPAGTFQRERTAMSEARHTKGPWIAVECCEGCPLPAGPPVAVHCVAEPWKRTGAVCTMVAQGDGKYDPEVTWANANLIAAAPDLLEACEIAVLMSDRRDWTQRHQEAWERMLDTLGRPEHHSHRNVDQFVLRTMVAAIRKATGADQ